MVTRPEDLARLLRGTVLEDREVAVVEQTASGESVFGIDVRSADEVVDAWRAAQRLVPHTGRWPIISTHASAQPLFDLSALPAADPEESARLAMSVFAGLAEEEAHAFDGIEGWTGTYRDFLTFQLNNTKYRCGEVPSEEEIANALPESASAIVLDRWLMDWEEERQPTTGTEGGAHLEWFFDPLFDANGPQVLFTPATSGPLTLGYIDFWYYQPTAEFGFHRSLAGLIAVLRYWEDQYGARLVANWGTMLELVVDRPPSTLKAAWDLAREQDLIAPDTSARAGLATRAHARALLERRDWFLHSHP